VSVVLAAIVAYLIGCIPFAALAARAKGVDLRVHGSGNLGATNAIRVLGPAVGIPVLLADVAKGWCAAAIVPRIAGPPHMETAILCAAAAVAGHVFPVTLGLRGGKGVATAAGALFALAPGAIGIAAAAFVAVLLGTRYVSLASITASAALAIALWVEGAPLVLRVAGSAIALLVITRHRANVTRLARGTEPRVRLRRMRESAR
jgi:glycerol-3-phosphate acyltransferase PlsY